VHNYGWSQIGCASCAEGNCTDGMIISVDLSDLKFSNSPDFCCKQTALLIIIE